MIAEIIITIKLLLLVSLGFLITLYPLLSRVRLTPNTKEFRASQPSLQVLATLFPPFLAFGPHLPFTWLPSFKFCLIFFISQPRHHCPLQSWLWLSSGMFLDPASGSLSLSSSNLFDQISANISQLCLWGSTGVPIERDGTLLHLAHLSGVEGDFRLQGGADDLSSAHANWTMGMGWMIPYLCPVFHGLIPAPISPSGIFRLMLQLNLMFGAVLQAQLKKGFFRIPVVLGQSLPS